MFKIILSPRGDYVNDTPPEVSKNEVKYRGVTYDLSRLEAGSEVEAKTPFIGKIKNIEGVFVLKLEYRYNTEDAESVQSNNWDDYTFELSDGKCPCPIKRREVKNEY